MICTCNYTSLAYFFVSVTLVILKPRYAFNTLIFKRTYCSIPMSEPRFHFPLFFYICFFHIWTLKWAGFHLFSSLRRRILYICLLFYQFGLDLFAILEFIHLVVQRVTTINVRSFGHYKLFYRFTTWIRRIFRRCLRYLDIR